MDCRKAQQLFDELAQDRLAPDVATGVRQHLSDCTDCRVLEQRSARLQRLLALKRHERPAQHYLDGFLADFHRRLVTETQRPAGWWEHALACVDEFLATGSNRVWRYSFASAMSVAVLVGLMWTGLRQMSQPGPIVAAQPISTQPPLALAGSFLPASRSTPRTIGTQLSHVVSADYDPATGGNMKITPAATDSPMPRYVLDRISVTPASYDVASVHF